MVETHHKCRPKCGGKGAKSCNKCGQPLPINPSLGCGKWQCNYRDPDGDNSDDTDSCMCTQVTG